MAKPAFERFVNEYYALLVRLDNMRAKKLREMYKEFLRDVKKDYYEVEDPMFQGAIISAVVNQYLRNNDPNVFVAVIDRKIHREVEDEKDVLVEEAEVISTISVQGEYVVGFVGKLTLKRTEVEEEIEDESGNKKVVKVPHIDVNADGKVYLRNDFEYTVEEKDGKTNINVKKKES